MARDGGHLETREEPEVAPQAEETPRSRAVGLGFGNSGTWWYLCETAPSFIGSAFPVNTPRMSHFNTSFL